MKTFQVTVIETVKKTLYVESENEVMARIQFSREYPGYTDPNVAVTSVKMKDVQYLTELPEGYREEYNEKTGFITVTHVETGIQYTAKERENAISKTTSEVSRRQASVQVYEEAVDVAPTIED